MHNSQPEVRAKVRMHLGHLQSINNPSKERRESDLQYNFKDKTEEKHYRKRPNDSPEFNKTLGKALLFLFTTLGQSLRFTHATR